MPEPTRPYPTLEFECLLWQKGITRIAGIDEAGRGAWAGPVCTAVVILPPDPSLSDVLHQVRDSKLMTPAARTAWAPRIKSIAVAWGVAFASAREIESLGIVPATKLAASRALQGLIPQYLLTDFLIFPEWDLPQTALIKGDQRSLSVAAASVLAKTTRDSHMCDLEQIHPGYGFLRHKGYGTSQHRRAVRELGKCAEHRRTYSIHL